MSDKKSISSGKSPENNQNVDGERDPEENTAMVGQTDRNTNDQTVQSQDDSTDTQLAAGFSNLNVFDRKGPVHVGAVPRQDETSPVYSEGIPDSLCITDSLGQSLEPEDAVWFPSRSSCCDHLPRPDETSGVYSEGIPDSVCTTDSEGRSLEAGASVGFPKRSSGCDRLPSPDETSPVYSEGIPDSVCITDNEGRSLEPGDVVWFMEGFKTYYGIYVGDQAVVWCQKWNGMLVHKEDITLYERFGKAVLFFRKGNCRLLTREVRVKRALARVGTTFTERDWWDDFDFLGWVFTGLGYKQAETRGFRLYDPSQCVGLEESDRSKTRKN